jgi:hypothetical protein
MGGSDTGDCRLLAKSYPGTCRSQDERWRWEIVSFPLILNDITLTLTAFHFRLNRIMGAYTDDSICSIDLAGAVSQAVYS